MSDGNNDVSTPRRQLLARIELDREQLADTLGELRLPLQSVQRLQENVRAIVPALFVAGAAFLILRALRGRRNRPVLALGAERMAGLRTTSLVVSAPRRISWFALVMQLVSAYRAARLVGEAMRTVSPATSAASHAAVEPAAPPGHPNPHFDRNPA